MANSLAGNPFPDFVRGLPDHETRAVDDRIRATVPAGCFLDTMGMELVRVGPGTAVAEMTVGEHHLNQVGACQGGVMIALADAAAGWAARASLPEDGRFATVSLASNILRAATAGSRLRAVATPVHRGRTTLVFDVAVRNAAEGDDAEGRLVATCTCTQLVMA